MENEQASETCWFCAKQRADGSSPAEVEMHRPIRYDRKAAEWYGLKDGWEPTTVYVPRCVSCKAVHDRTEGHVARGALAGLLVGVPLAALVFFYLFSVGRLLLLRGALILIGIAIGMAMLGGIGGWALSRAVTPGGVRDQGLATAHPNVKRKEEEGWKVGAKPIGEA